MTDSPVEALIEQWREMAKMAFAAGAIDGDDGHAARWHAVEMCADELVGKFTKRSSAKLRAIREKRRRRKGKKREKLKRFGWERCTWYYRR